MSLGSMRVPPRVSSIAGKTYSIASKTFSAASKKIVQYGAPLVSKIEEKRPEFSQQRPLDQITTVTQLIAQESKQRFSKRWELAEKELVQLSKDFRERNITLEELGLLGLKIGAFSFVGYFVGGYPDVCDQIILKPSF